MAGPKLVPKNVSTPLDKNALKPQQENTSMSEPERDAGANAYSHSEGCRCRVDSEGVRARGSVVGASNGAI